MLLTSSTSGRTQASAEVDERLVTTKLRKAIENGEVKGDCPGLGVLSESAAMVQSSKEETDILASWRKWKDSFERNMQGKDC